MILPDENNPLLVTEHPNIKDSSGPLTFYVSLPSLHQKAILVIV